jgi:hypothetical protein
MQEIVIFPSLGASLNEANDLQALSIILGSLVFSFATGGLLFENNGERMPEAGKAVHRLASVGKWRNPYKYRSTHRLRHSPQHPTNEPPQHTTPSIHRYGCLEELTAETYVSP